MALLPVLLFLLGIICLIWALRMEDSSKSSQEILTVLQGLAGVKKEIGKAQKDLREVERQLGDHELRLIRNENVQEELRSQLKDQQIFIERKLELTKQMPQPEQTSSPVIPEKYQKVLELYRKGWSVSDIAGHLSISRDAVDMILRTFISGKELGL